MRISLQLNQSLLQDWQSAMLTKRWWEIIKDLQEKKLLGNSGLWPSAWAFVPRSQLLLLCLTVLLGAHASIIYFILSAWDLITLDSLLAHEHFLTHHNILSFKADSEIHFFPLLPLLWAVMVHGTLHSRVLFHLSSAVLLKNMCVPKDWHQCSLTH